jgi:cysteine-rich repeat protein
MKLTLRSLGAGTFLLAVSVGDAWAIPADSADDICAPATNPCVITQIYNVTGPLDFGLRTVRITGAGRLFGEPDISLSAGQLEVDTGDAAAIDTDNGGGVSIAIYRACSGDGTTPCLDDTDCTPGSLGTCSAGNTGTILFDGRISGAGVFPDGGSITSAGDMALLQRASFQATGPGMSGPSVFVESTMGSVTVDFLGARSGTGIAYYEIGYGGYISIHAAVDVTITGSIDAWGAGEAGQVDVEAGRDIFLASQIIGNAGKGQYANGGYVTLTAGRDLVIAPGESGDEAQEINTDGGGGFYFYGYGGYGSLRSGYGGYQYLIAGEDISVANSANIHSHGGPGASGGRIKFFSDGMTTIDGNVRSVGPLPFRSGEGGAVGGNIGIYADGGVTLGSTGLLETASPMYGGNVYIDADGPVVLNGDIDVRGTAPLGYYTYATSGYFTLEGMADVSVGGTIRAGARWSGADLTIDVCRLELTSTGVIDNSFGNNPFNGDNVIKVHESMSADPGSKILADKLGGTNNIQYRDSYKPPILNGTVTPAPLLATNPGLNGCPICGNFEIDEGETCDDGNTTSGDGCRADCQDEGCLAESPGFPSTPMCDDGDGCTRDHCDATTHHCTNVVSCEEGVQCTVDQCVSGACQHAPDDSLCDDVNECTDDLCNPTNGCVHANLTGGACDDYDFCTVATACDNGDCLATDLALSQDNKLSVGLKAGPANDRMTAKLNLPLAQLTANPTATGVKVVLLDQSGDTIYEADLPAAQWEDSNGAGQKFRFRDTQGTAGPANGIGSASIKRNEAKGLAKTILKMKGSEIPGAAGQEFLSISLLFGLDPSTDDCLTGRLVPCTVSSTSLKCSD